MVTQVWMAEDGETFETDAEAREGRIVGMCDDTYEFTPEQLADFHGEAADPASIVYAKELLRLMPPGERNRRMFLRRIFCNDTLKCIGEKEHISADRVRVVLNTFLKRYQAKLRIRGALRYARGG